MRGAPRLRGVLATVAAGHGLVLVGAAVPGVLAVVSPVPDGTSFIGIVAAAAAVALLVAGVLGIRGALEARAAIGADGANHVHLPGLHRAVRPALWCAAATVLTAPLMVVTILAAAADPDRPLLFVPLLTVFPAFAAALQLLTMVRLYLGDVPLRGRRARR